MITLLKYNKKKISLILLSFIILTSLYHPSASQALACPELNIPRLSLKRCVTPGDQSHIDSGNVVLWYNENNVTWIVGHRSSHGSTFLSLPKLRIGDLVNYSNSWFIINEMRLVNRHNLSMIEDLITSKTPRLLLQTSKSGSIVYFWRAEKLDLKWN